MSDVVMYDEELLSLEDRISVLLRSCDATDQPAIGGGTQRNPTVQRANDFVRRAEKIFHQFKVEVRMLDGKERELYEKSREAHQRKIAELKEALRAKEEELNAAAAAYSAQRGREDLSPYVWSPTEGSTAPAEAYDASGRVTSLQKGTLQSLAATEKTVGETEEIGVNVSEQLGQQTEQIQRVNENLDQLDSNVGRAKKELKALARSLMTDKIIIGFSILVALGIIVVVVMKIVQEKRK